MPAPSHTAHAAARVAGTSDSKSIMSLTMALRHPREGAAASKRIFGEKRLENRRSHALAGHRRPQRLIDIRTVVVIEHQDDDHAALIGGVVRAGRSVVADIQLA